MIGTNKCPNCGENKKPWFPLCWKCSEKEKNKPICEKCGKHTSNGKPLCLDCWKEKEEAKKEIKKVDYVKKTKVKDYKKNFESGKIYDSPFGKVRSKSELIIAIFLHANDFKKIEYEKTLFINDVYYKPDFIIQEDNKTVILEHFGMSGDEDYDKNMEHKKEIFTKYCKENEGIEFIYTTEEDIKNIKDKLGYRFNKNTSIHRDMWN
ncbi:hypothetical protein K8R30_00275 [archaeon]|nr:hypothetical protein [archaeon]